MRCGRGMLGLIVMLAVSLGAGILRGPGPASATAAGWVLPAEPVTINEWDGGDGTKSALLRELIAQYEQMHPNVTVKFETDVKSLKRSEEHTSELQSPCNLVCRLLLEKKK